jgi:hypothetical protein
MIHVKGKAFVALAFFITARMVNCPLAISLPMRKRPMTVLSPIF